MADLNFQASFSRAIQDFHDARRKAVIEQIVGRLTGHASNLLSYEAVVSEIGPAAQMPKKLREIPLDSIVGSVGRYTDFTRSFFPKGSIQESRWAGVKVAVSGLVGLPPIEAYQISQVYFVLDGNHRVSIARQLGASHIEAYVTELLSDVELTPEDDLDDLIVRAEHQDFLKKTTIEALRPGADLRVTSPGGSPTLEKHIEVHRYFMGQEQQRDVPLQEAVASWYDQVYLPAVQVIRRQGVLRAFPGRTETDLYLWVSQYQDQLTEELGFPVDKSRAAARFGAQSGSGLGRLISGIGERVLGAISDADPGSEPSEALPPGERPAPPSATCLFGEILVPVRGDTGSWAGLEQALVVAGRESARIYGLHVAPEDGRPDETLQDAFRQRCEAAGIPGQLVFSSGRVAGAITLRAPWTDLVVLKMDHSPPQERLARIGSGLRQVIRESPVPVMALPGETSPLENILLAYDGSPRGEEALYVATYLAGAWEVPLTVLHVSEGADEAAQPVERAQEYAASCGVEAVLVKYDGPVAAEILVTAEERGCDLIVMGGSHHNPLTDIFLESVIDEVLRSSWIPVLICS